MSDDRQRQQPHLLRSFCGGMAMGSADAVPGVSGGTIALILGFYERLLASLGDVIGVARRPTDGQRWRQAIGQLPFLAPLGLGIALAYYLATRLLVGSYDPPPAVIAEGTAALQAHLAQDPPTGLLLSADTAPIVFAFFFGLVLWSVKVPWLLRVSRHPGDLPLALLGAVIAGGVALSPAAGGADALWFYAVGGALAISAMLLPGISGSLVLLVLGLYQPVAASIHHPRQYDILGSTLIGIVIGAGCFIPFLRWLLARHHDRCMALLSGMMVGSLVALWPWKAHYLPRFIPQLGPMSPELPGGPWWWSVCAALAGMAVIALGERLSSSQNQPCPPGG